jgi:hypothetical protein
LIALGSTHSVADNSAMGKGNTPFDISGDIQARLSNYAVGHVTKEAQGSRVLGSGVSMRDAQLATALTTFESWKFGIWGDTRQF